MKTYMKPALDSSKHTYGEPGLKALQEKYPEVFRIVLMKVRLEQVIRKF